MRDARSGADPLTALALAVLTVLSPAAQARTASAPFAVTAAVTPECSGFTASTMNFGNTPAGSDVAAAATLQFTCSDGTAYTITADGTPGPGFSCSRTSAQGLMRSATETLPFGLFTDAQRRTPLATTPACARTAAAITGTGSGTSSAVTLYGEVRASDSAQVTPAAFNATVTLMLSF